jgi:hypothetical protein
MSMNRRIAEYTRAIAVFAHALLTACVGILVRFFADGEGEVYPYACFGMQ